MCLYLQNKSRLQKQAAMCNSEILDKYSKPRKKLPEVGTY